MSTRNSARRQGTRIALGAAAALGVASGFVAVLGTGTAAAQTATPTLQYTCSFPVIDGEPITARISTDIPTSLAVGASSLPFAIKAAAEVNTTFAFELRHILGVQIMEGSLDAETTVIAPQGEIPISVHLTITRTSIPAYGSFEIPATGTAPTLSFSKVGRARITAGKFTLHLVPKDANGNITLPGKIDVPCTLNTGQDNVVSTFDITTAATTAASATSGTGRRTASATAAPTTRGTTSSPTSSGSSSGTPTVMPSTTTAMPEPTRSTINAAATSATTTGGPGAVSLILLAAGALAAAVAALRFGPRLKNRRRPGGDG